MTTVTTKRIETRTAAQEMALELLRRDGRIDFNEAVKRPVLLNALRQLTKHRQAPVFFSGATCAYHLSLVACVTVH